VSCGVLQCAAVCCSVLQCVAALQYAKEPCILTFDALIHSFEDLSVAVCCSVCSVLQCVAVCCSVLQCVALCCSDAVCKDALYSSI